LHFAGSLVGLSLGFQLLIAKNLPGGFFHRSLGLFGRAFDSIFVHGVYGNDPIEVSFQVAHWSILYRLQEHQTRILLSGGTASVPAQENVMKHVLIALFIVPLLTVPAFAGSLSAGDKPMIVAEDVGVEVGNVGVEVGNVGERHRHRDLYMSTRHRDHHNDHHNDHHDDRR
jgi:hypothetical protein